MKKLTLALLILLTGCASTSYVSSRGPVATLDVSNMTGGFVTISLENGWRIQTVTRMRECVKIYERDIIGASDLFRLTFKILGEDLVTSPTIDLTQSWSIELGSWAAGRIYDMQSLTPAPRCDLD